MAQALHSDSRLSQPGLTQLKPAPDLPSCGTLSSMDPPSSRASSKVSVPSSELCQVCDALVVPIRSLTGPQASVCQMNR